MINVYIDNVKLRINEGKTVIEAAFENNIYIPHFCWHPELSVSGNCRMCLVEIGFPKRLPDGTFEKDSNGNLVVSYFPKLQIACATIVSDGMHVRTKSPVAIQAQEAVMEFLLINHPLDCPICDEAGQCKLQEYAFRNSTGESRFDDEKNHKDKRVYWSENIIFDGERCISCSRCIRFTKEYASQDVLSFVNRNDHVTIKLYDGAKLDNPYSMNIIDICPVGALTSRDFRFKSRVWEMSFNRSVCPGCSRGCNINIGVRNNEILRLEPASNPYVNKFWMCDYGRLELYKSVNENRLTKPHFSKDGSIIPGKWQDLFLAAANELKKFKPSEIMFIASPFATNEDLYLFSSFAKKVIKSGNIDFKRHNDFEFADGKLKTSDITPNSAGAAELGCLPANSQDKIENLAGKVNSGLIKAIYIIDDFLANEEWFLELAAKASLVIAHASNISPILEKAHFVFAASTFTETEGTFTNINKRIQHFEPVLVTGENLRYMGMKMSRSDKFGSDNDRWTRHEFRDCLPNWMIIKGIANHFNAGWKFADAEEIFNEIVRNIASFDNMSYGRLDEYQGLILCKAAQPDPKVINYKSFYLKPE